MPTVRQLPAKLDLECIAGDPFTVTITATGITTLTSPAVTMTTSGGDAYTTDPGIPTASVAGLAVTSAWSTSDTAALNATTRGKTYRYSIAANPDSAGLFEIVAGTLTVHPVGHAGTSSASSATLAVTVGTTAVSLAVALGGGGGGGASALDDLTDVTITTATNGQVLKYNGSAWVNGTDATGGGGGTLDDLTDVTITAAATGDILRYNGSAWVDAVGTTHFEAAGGIATHAAVTSSVHGISAFGATLVDDADAATARTTLGVVAASDTASGIVELATTAETTTGTDTTRAVTPAGLLNATTASNITARTVVKKAGTTIGTRRGINFIEGSGVTITTADDAGNEEVDVTIAASGGGGGTLPIGGGAPLAANLIGYGLPNIAAPWGTTSFSATVGWIWCVPFTCTESETYDAYDMRVDTAQASALFDIAVYSCADWKSGTTMTKVSGTETTGTSLATTGTKTPTLGASKTLTAGRYVLAYITYGSASPPLLWALSPTGGLMGSRVSNGTNAAPPCFVQASGASSLAASYSITKAADSTTIAVVMRRA